MTRRDSRLAIITGVSSGIGKELVIKLLAKGFNVIGPRAFSRGDAINLLMVACAWNLRKWMMALFLFEKD